MVTSSTRDASSIEGPLRPSLLPHSLYYRVVTPNEEGGLDVILVEAQHAGPAMRWLVEGMDTTITKVHMLSSRFVFSLVLSSLSSFFIFLIASMLFLMYSFPSFIFLL
jgi:hypothetical protein